MNKLYADIIAEYSSQLSALKSFKVHERMQNLALKLAEDGFQSINKETGVDSTNYRHLYHLKERSASLLNLIQAAYDHYGNSNLEKSLDLALGILSSKEVDTDPILKIDALHLVGRIEYDNKNYDHARKRFLTAMEESQIVENDVGYCRSLHEISRVESACDELIKAECGFRICLDYYSAAAYYRKGGRDSALYEDNINAALKCLHALSDQYASFSDGPRNADRLVDSLGSSKFSCNDSSGFEFLLVRSLAISVLVKQQRQRSMARLLGHAMKLYEQLPEISRFAFEEANWVSFCIGGKDEILPEVLQGRIRDISETKYLKDAPCYKAEISEVYITDDIRKYTSPEQAASSIVELQDYLKESDRYGRYVYRGQTREYEGPLFPSSFRSILRQEYGSGLEEISGKPNSLRTCGKSFWGEYNRCFLQYSNPVGHLLNSGYDKNELRSIASIYKKILTASETSARQQFNEQYIPWLKIVSETSTKEEYMVFEDNKKSWIERINNYHRRVYRMGLFIKLFEYTLGTTFAQQYGLSSEGLDATKCIDVAAFFATYNSDGFRETMQNGIGIIYRIPFPHNDVATEPIGKYSYYSLPSIIDVQDVMYRFEARDLPNREMPLALETYIGATIIDGLRAIDLFTLPSGFFPLTRVAAQEAVIIFPDEIREDLPDREPGIGGINFPKYRLIEDISKRNGVEKFYFHHTGRKPESSKPLSRELLWPRDDPLLEMAFLIVMGVYPLRFKHVMRPDLIDVGYDNEIFIDEYLERLWSKRPIFWNESEMMAASSFSLVF